ncbi:ABC transporter ATP-binding protein [[Clostridium] polysaccharolyticum]|uniref:ABC-type quaternary amine transporter n=1 Tax=[Clostridium] polysaccharolyticum TaxID=29364 RepID=A0A1I0AF73_9FIRM|nr:ABC transporter ATP-binding protein [[Clostridium] polysaccharolyticum]SES92930.1 NitT/TauT family transport system ATP-binding protein [[Clostridium] polysaccharolyticum]
MYIKIEDVSKVYENSDGSTFQALNHVNLEIERGEFICLLGASGCGKTTLLNTLAGFEKVTSGRITIDGKEIEKPDIQNITIFQNYGLLPWRTVEKNVELGLEAKKIPKKQRYDIAMKYIEMVGLERFHKSYPRQLSGGMQQRVAIARALAVDPEIIFMDEPLGALDAITRMKMQEEILKIQKEQKKTVIFVTHDIEEAVFLADRIVIMTPNPAKVKSVMTVPLGSQRDRTSLDFIKVRNQVFEAFEMKPSDTTEYYI